MRIGDKNRTASGAISKEFLEFARAYLSEAFPNPDRAGCPPDSALRSLAFNPRESDAAITEHLGTCSPCFRRYSEWLAEQKAQGELERSPWVRVHAWLKVHAVLAGTALFCAAVLLIGVGLLLRGIRQPNVPPMETYKQPPPQQTQGPTVAYTPFSLDLRASSPVRGTGSSQAGHPRLALPSPTVDLTVTLPLASPDGQYDLKLTSGGSTFWSKAALAHLRKGKTLIDVEADFKQVPAGNYNFEVRSSTGIRFIQPVSLPSRLSSGGEPRP